MNLSTLITTISLWFVVKVMILTLLAFYIIFAFVIVRQEQLMARVVETNYADILQFFALVHFFSAVTVFVLALLFL